MQLLFLLKKFLGKLIRSFYQLLYLVFVCLPVGVLILIFPSLDRALHRALHREIKKGILSLLGVIYASLRQYKKAINFFQKSLPIYQELKDRKGEANVLNDLGDAYKNLGQYERAIDFHERSLRIC